MRLGRPSAALALVALLAAGGCRAGDDPGASAAPPTARGAPAAASAEPPARLCEAIPDDVVATVTGRSPVTVDGAGTQCSWRAPSPTEAVSDVVLQGSFIDARSYDLGRPVGAATPVAGLGDDAYVVRVPGEAPVTLYVRDGHRAFALWLQPGASDPARAEATLAELARAVLAS